MVLSEGEAEARLGEFRKRRDALDRAINDLVLYLELGRRLKGGPMDAAAPEGASTSQTDAFRPRRNAAVEDTPRGTELPIDEQALSPVARARQKGRVLIDEISAILAEAGHPLHAADLLDRLSARGFSLPGKDPVAALNTRLWKRSTPRGPLRRVGKARYALADDGSD